VSDVLDRPRARKELRLLAEDFRPQLWIGLTLDTGANVLPRYEIAWGQERIDMPVVESGTYDEFQVYDRPEGGEPLIAGYLTPPVAAPKTTSCTVTICLTCNFWP